MMKELVVFVLGLASIVSTYFLYQHFLCRAKTPGTDR
jgi:hypothetical protein